MIPAIQRYIKEHTNKWPVGVQPSQLWPLLRSNVNYNYVENYPLITRVVFWLTEEDSYPSLVTKIMDESLKPEAIRRCITFEEDLNARLGYELFPKIFEIADISGRTVIFEEAVKSPTYENELNSAILGPQRSLPRLRRALERQFKEMGELFRSLQNMRTPENPQSWGDWAYQLGEDFRNACGFKINSLTGARLNEIRRAIDSVPVYKTPVLADLVCPNIFPGPRLIDNIDPRIDELNAQLPGIINVFRFIVTYFYSPPVRDVFNDWLYAIAVAITDKEGYTIIGPPVRGILRQVGLDPEQPDVIWAFIVAATLFEMKDKLDFYRDSPFVTGAMKDEFHQRVDRMMEIQASINRNKSFDVSLIIRAQDIFYKEKVAPSFSPERIMLNLFPPLLRPGLVKLYFALYPRLRGVSFLRKTRRYLVNKLFHT